ncbi:glucose-6-phosphate dehydrogenase [Dactylosporangium sp. NPDC050688]|uniref:glucose-6-phosphate dehydrogenase n=1 Tax=Dactylosporangium sp. NPDC050688 TaxID=3157217 RepID=UPI0033F79A3B
MIQQLVILGATGDLTARFLLPALGALRAGGHIDERFGLTCVGREDWTGDAYRAWAAEQLDRHAPGIPAGRRREVVAAARYHRADVTDPGELAPVLPHDEPVAAYLALPPSIFPATVTALHTAGTATGSTVVLEKPFGESLHDALELNQLLAGRYPERSIFRVDHFLAMSTVLNLLGVRLANRVLEPIWNGLHIERIDIVWDESLALEGRAGYYDGVGALKDMLQNHLLQLLCLVAMEPPVSLGDRDLRDRKMDVLRSVRPLGLHDAAQRSRRARYTAGAGVPAYVDEDGVDPMHHTETFAELELELDNWRWPGTRFRLRTGKALRAARQEVAVHFRPVPHLPFSGDVTAVPNVLRFGLEPESVSLHLTGTTTRGDVLTPLTLAATPEPADLPPYGRLLLDVLHGNPALSIRADEAEESWRVVTPVLDAWAKDLVPMEEYPAGSDGPAPRRA